MSTNGTNGTNGAGGSDTLRLKSLLPIRSVLGRKVSPHCPLISILALPIAAGYASGSIDASRMIAWFSSHPMLAEASMDEYEVVLKNKRKILGNNTILEGMLRYCNSKGDIYYHTRNFLSLRDASAPLSTQPEHTISNNTKAISDGFAKAEMAQFKLTTVQGSVGYYCMTETRMGGEVWLAMLVVAPHNFHYQRLHLLAKGSIDLKHCVLLVNEDLDTDTSPISPALKKIFRGRITERLEAALMPIIRVPNGFIEANCFMQPFELEARRPMARKAEVKTLAEVFRNYIRTQGHIMLDGIYGSGPAEAKREGPLVPPAPPTSTMSDRMQELGFARVPNLSDSRNSTSITIDVETDGVSQAPVSQYLMADGRWEEIPTTTSITSGTPDLIVEGGDGIRMYDLRSDSQGTIGQALSELRDTVIEANQSFGSEEVIQALDSIQLEDTRGAETRSLDEVRSSMLTGSGPLMGDNLDEY